MAGRGLDKTRCRLAQVAIEHLQDTKVFDKSDAIGRGGFRFGWLSLVPLHGKERLRSRSKARTPDRPP
jgi:hypothetical protein